MPVMNRRGRRNVVSSTPRRRGGRWGRAASFAPAAAATASHAVCQPTRNDRATAAAATPRRSRSVNRLRAGICAEDSVKDPTQPGASQRNRRLCHTSTTGRAKLCKSRTRWVRRCLTRPENVPQPGHAACRRRQRTCTSSTPSLRSASVAGALVAVASRVIVGSAFSFVSGQLGDLLLLVVVSVTAGAVWRLGRTKRQRSGNGTDGVPDRSTAEPLDVSQRAGYG